MTSILLNATETNNQQLVRTMMKPFMHQNGDTNYLQILRVPSSERIPVLAKQNRQHIHSVLIMQIEFAFRYFTLKTPMTPEQIFLLSDEIIESSEFDNLSVQDVYLFLVKLATGKMGKVYERMDIPTFMEMFEQHRDERHKTVVEFRYEEAAQHKAMGDPERESDNQGRERELMRSAIGDHLKEKYKDGNPDE